VCVWLGGVNQTGKSEREAKSEGHGGRC